MGTDKKRGTLPGRGQHDSESALSPPFDLVRSVFDVTGLASLLPPPMESGGLPTVPIGFAGIKPQ
jgi:hypothetical protein